MVRSGEEEGEVRRRGWETNRRWETENESGRDSWKVVWRGYYVREGGIKNPFNFIP